MEVRLLPGWRFVAADERVTVEFVTLHEHHPGEALVRRVPLHPRAANPTDPPAPALDEIRRAELSRLQSALVV